MTRKLAALLPALALALCYARAGSWAARAPAGEHACCGRGAAPKAAPASDCCMAAAATGSVHLVRSAVPALAAAVAAALPAARLLAFSVPAFREAAPGLSRRAFAPARAPPLA